MPRASYVESCTAKDSGGAEFLQKMRKSLGAKRKELGNGDIERIVNLYRAFEANEWSHVFDNDDFGYQTITVERPLRLNYAVSSERVGRIDESMSLAKLGKDLPKFKQALAKLDTTKVWNSRESFQKVVRKALDAAGLSLAPPQQKALWQALSERDETAEVCTDGKGNPEPDADLRDTENVPLKDNVEAYFEREVQPHVPHAWIDHEKTKVGYEIAFNRYFYKYIPPRPLEEIDRDLKALSGEIMGLLAEVTA